MAMSLASVGPGSRSGQVSCPREAFHLCSLRSAAPGIQRIYQKIVKGICKDTTRCIRLLVLCMKTKGVAVTSHTAFAGRVEIYS